MNNLLRLLAAYSEQPSEAVLGILADALEDMGVDTKVLRGMKPVLGYGYQMWRVESNCGQFVRTHAGTSTWILMGTADAAMRIAVRDFVIDSIMEYAL